MLRAELKALRLFVYRKSLHINDAPLRWLNRVIEDHEARASDINILVVFAIFQIKATETQQTRAKICCTTVTSKIKAFSPKLKLLKHRHF